MTTILTPPATPAAIHADAEMLEVAAHRGHLPDMAGATAAVLVLEIAWSRSYAASHGGVGAVIAEDYCDGPEAFCARLAAALRVSRLLHTTPELLPVLSGPVPTTDQLAAALLAETAGEGVDGA
jgi:hypothetical protein